MNLTYMEVYGLTKSIIQFWAATSFTKFQYFHRRKLTGGPLILSKQFDFNLRNIISKENSLDGKICYFLLVEHIVICYNACQKLQ
jgi:hypothetical protein